MKLKRHFSSKDLSQLAFIASLAFHFGIWMGLYVHNSMKIAMPSKQTKIEVVVLEQPKPKSKTPPPPVPPPPPKAETQVVQQDKTPTKDNKPNPNAKYLGAKNQAVNKETKVVKSGKFKNAEAKKNEIVTDEKSDIAQQSDSSQTDDYLKEVSAGMQTMLNTQEFAYYNYYQQIKEKVKKNWEPLVGNKVRLTMNQNRGIASTGDHVTRILIIIDKAGDLSKVDIVGGSGLQDADNAAIEAFKKASPFGTPPKGLVNAAGEVRMRWDFVLESLD